MTRFVRALIWGLFAIAFPSTGANAPSPSPLPINIQADSATVSETLGKSEYFGNVVISQGDLKITAEQVTLLSDKKSLTSITALGESGAPARFERSASSARPGIIAEAKTIEYQVPLETLMLLGDALLQQGEDRYQGSRLSYNLQQGLFKVEDDGTSADRINLIINPKP